MLMDIKASKAKLSEIIDNFSVLCLANLLAHWRKLLFLFPFYCSFENVLTPLATMASASAIDPKKDTWVMSGKSRKRDHFSHFDKDMDDIVGIIKLLENSGILIDGVNKTLKHEIKNKKVNNLVLLGTLDASTLGNMTTGKGITRARKGVLRAGTGYNTMDFMGKIF